MSPDHAPDHANEIKVLLKYLPKAFSCPDQLSHAEKKFYLMSEIRRHHGLAAGLRMTNLSGSDEIALNNQIKFKYGYRRQAIETRISKSALPLLAGPSYKGQWVTPFMTSSGQAATATALLALKHHHKNAILAVPDGLYWETAEFCRAHEIQFMTYEKAVLRKDAMLIGFIDSSTVSSLEKSLAEMEKIELLIADTTCWDVNGPERALLEIEAGKRPLICLRSHIKLDSLGAEFGSLGSLVAHFSGESDLVRGIASHGRLIGAWSELDNVYPFLLDPEFHWVNSRRNGRLQAVGRRIAHELKKARLPSGVELRSFSHGLFFYLEFAKNSYPGPDSLKLGLLGTLLKVANLRAREVDSFGFDFLAYKLFPGLPDPEAPLILRLTSPDYTDEECRTLIEALGNWMRQIAP